MVRLPLYVLRKLLTTFTVTVFESYSRQIPYLLVQMPEFRNTNCLPIGKQFVQDVIFGLRFQITNSGYFYMKKINLSRFHVI